MGIQQVRAEDHFDPLNNERSETAVAAFRALVGFPACVASGLFTRDTLARYLCVEFIRMGHMARGKSGSKSKSVWEGAPRFIDVSLNAAAKEEFSALKYTVADVLGELERIMTDGHRVGIAFSAERSCYTVSLTGRDDGCPNKGLCMTSFANAPLRALALAVYKHQTVCGGVWGTAGDTDGDEFG